MAEAKSTKNPALKIATCKNCGTEFPKVTNNAYCSADCKSEFMRVYHREWKRRNEAPQRAARKKLARCLGGCGSLVEYATNARVYCASCRLEKRRASAKAQQRVLRESDREGFNQRQRAYVNRRYREDHVFAMRKRMSRLIGAYISAGGHKKKTRTMEILGVDSWGQFASHIERQFCSGMSWDNRDKWHIDHIVPISSATTEQEVLALNHFTNLRPMWAAENMSKGASQVYLI